MKIKLEQLIGQFEKAEIEANYMANVGVTQSFQQYQRGKVFAYRDILCDLRLALKTLTHTA